MGYWIFPIARWGSFLDTPREETLIDYISELSIPSLNLNLEPKLNPYLDLNKQLDYDKGYDLKTEADIKITLEQMLSNTNIEKMGYSYSKDITTGVIYDLLGLSRIRKNRQRGQA